MRQRPPSSTRPDTPCPDTTFFRSDGLDERIGRGVERLALAADIGGRLDRDRAGRDSLARVVLAVPGEIVLACLQRADRDGPERLAGGILDRDAGVGRTFGNVDLAIDRAGRILDGGRARCEDRKSTRLNSSN